MVVTASTGPQGGIRHCDLPCFSIDDFTNSFFDVSSCGSCAAAAAYSKTATAWDGVLRPYIPIIVGEFNFWDGCSYSFGRNGGEILSSSATHKGKKLVGSWTDFGDPMNVSPPGTIITIRCDDGSSGTETIWQGTHDSLSPDSKPVIRIAGCSPGPEFINLTKLSAMGCVCDDRNPAGCPTDAECAACDRNSETRGWIFEVSGFSTSSPNCSSLNGTHKIKDKTTTCIWGDQHSSSTSPESRLECIDRGNGDGIWMYQDGLGAGPIKSFSILGQVEDGENCPPRPEDWTPIQIWGACDCSAQKVTGAYRYGVL